MNLPDRWRAWRPPAGWIRILSVDAHVGGEPLRVIMHGFPDLEGNAVLQRRREAIERHDALRRAVMWEPRGHADMYGCVVMPPVTPVADASVLFMHNEGFSTMCGHGVIGVVTVLIETGVFPADEPETVIGLDTPAGFVEATARVEGGRVRSVEFVNVPSFVLDLDAEVEVPGLGRVRYDLAFGEAFYAYVRAADVGLSLVPEEVGRIVGAGRAVKRAVAGARPVRHPLDPDLGFLYGTIFVGPARGPGAGSRNVCVFADGEVDRSPTGTGVSGRLALHHARGEVDVGETIVVESLVGSRFTGSVAARATVGPYPAVVPKVGGDAHIIGRNEILIDPEDPFRAGFLIR